MSRAESASSPRSRSSADLLCELSLVVGLTSYCLPYAWLIAIALGGAGLIRLAGNQRLSRALAVTGIILGSLGYAFSPLNADALGLRGRANEERARVKCARNLHSISLGLRDYTSSHSGFYPPGLIELEKQGFIVPDNLWCPFSYDGRWDNPPASDEEARASGHLSYIFLGAGLQGEVAPDRPIVIEVGTHHGRDGYHMLFADGTVKFVSFNDVVVVLQRLAAEGVIHESAIPSLLPQE